MKTNFTIKNFRVFDNNGATVEIAPLTFLVGCNSSGKSSIVKALTLLKTFAQQKIDKDHPVLGSIIDFSIKPNDSLGSFNNTVRSSSKDRAISLEYDVHSCYIDQDLTVSLVLIGADLRNAEIGDVDISIKNGSCFCSTDGYSKSRGRIDSIKPIKEAFKKYLLAIRFRSLIDDEIAQSGFYGDPYLIQSFKEEQLKDTNPNYKKAIRYCKPDYLKAVLNDRNILSCSFKGCEEQAFDRFLETGILSYYSILDEIGNLSSPEDICAVLKSKIKNHEYKEIINAAIDLICKDYCASHSLDFFSYYCFLEDEDALRGLSKHKLLYGSNNSYWIEDDRDSSILGRYKDSIGHHYSSYAFWPELFDEVTVDFKFVREMLFHLSDNDPFIVSEKRGFDEQWYHPLYTNAFKQFIDLLLSDIFSHDITEDIEYISSSRIQVRRLYPLEDNNEFSYAVKRYFETRRKYMSLNPPITVNVENEGGIVVDGKNYHSVEITDFVPGFFINKWLQIFNIGDHMSMEMDKYGLGLLLKLYRTKLDKKGILMADMGYGITQLFSFLLQVEEMIMSGLYDQCYSIGSSAYTVYGHFEIGSMKAQTVAIEEPEIHLHPKYQSLLAEMIYEAYRDYNIQFIIETHSEYLLRKIQTLIGSKHLTPDEVSMIYVEDDAEVKKGAKKVRRIPIKADGRLAEPFGPGFYDEADNLSLALFINMGK